MGEVILTRLLDEAGLSDRVIVSSSGVGDWHVGEPADPRTVDVLAAHGYDGSTHRASEFDPAQFDDIDLVLASDEGHVQRLRRLARTREHQDKIRLVREFDAAAVAAGTLETSDPWYGDGEHFRRCFTEVEAACQGILEHVRGRLEMERR